MISDTFVKTYGDRIYKHVTMVRHHGVVIAFAMDHERRIFYTVLDLKNDKIESPLDVNFWLANPVELVFPNEIAKVGVGVADQVSLPVVKKGSRTPAPPGTMVSNDETDYFLSTTARFSEDAPFQALTDGGYVYIFRQAVQARHADNLPRLDPSGEPVFDIQGKTVQLVDNTLLVDRFILSGNELKTKMEVRFQRSRSKTRPQSRKDSLGAKDMDNKPFYEPTQELFFVSNLIDGRFSALLLPTQLPNVDRWQIFAHNNKTGMIDSYNVQRSDDGLFNTRGTQESSESGHAESALDFGEGNTRIELSTGVNLGSRFCLEAWILPRSTAPSGKDQALIGGSGRTNDGAPSVWITQRTAICAGFGDGSRWYEIASGNLLQLNEWNHIAVVFDGTTYRVYLNGEERYRTKDARAYIDGKYTKKEMLEGKTPLNSTRNFGSGSAGEGFYGVLDEIRMWNRSRSGSELKRDRNTRLTGFEPGLVGYWRFDEASGDTVFDQSNNAVNGTISGSGWKWVTSEAPLGENAGLQRNSFKAAGRNVASGLTSLLYYQQEVGQDGKGGQTKPLKRSGRVMLAFATQASSGGNKQVTALDFGISDLGRLAQAPDYLQLQVIQPPNSDGLTVSERLQRISDLEQRLTTLNQDIFNLTGEISTLDQIYNILIAAIQDRATSPIPAGADLSLKTRLDAKLQNLQAARRTAIDKANEEQQLWFEYYSGKVQFYEHTGFGGRSISVQQGFVGYTYLKQVGFNDTITAIYVPRALQVTVYEHANRGGKSRLFTSSSANIGAEWNDIISSADVAINPAFQQQITDVSSARQKAEADINTITSDLQAELADILALRNAREEEQTAKRRQATSASTELQAHQGQLGEGPSVSMPLIYVDPSGLSISGGLLSFAWTNDAPTLFDSAIGKLALYFRGSDDQFFVCYYSTKTQRARYLLNDERGRQSILCLARSTEPEMDNLKIEVQAGDDDEFCTVNISGAGMQETWEAVPRSPERFAQVLNGRAKERAYIGSGVLETEQGRVERLTIKDGVRRSIDKGALLVAGEIKLRVREAAARGETSISVDSGATNPPGEELPFFYFEYDYADLAHTDKVPGDLSNGSLLVWAAALQNDQPIKIGQETQSGSTLVSQWTAALPGHTLSFDGANDVVRLADASAANLKKFAAPGDVTLEAWVRPREMDGEARLLQQRSADSSYTLGLKRQPLSSALLLDGVDDLVTIPNKEHLNFNGAITIEAWIKPVVPDKFTGVMNIVAHGYVSSPASEVFLRIAGDAKGVRYEAGTWDGANHSAVFDMPAADKTGDNWVHLAGVYDGLAWNLYHNGELKASQNDPTGALPVNADWAIGSRGGAKERLFKGEIDDVRIWKKARSDKEIQADMLRRLGDLETDLVGYWHFVLRSSQDHSRFGNHGAVLGDPKTTISPLPAYQVFTGAGERFVESQDVFPGGSWTHLAAVYNQSYAVELDGSPGSYLDCGKDATLEITGDLTIEVFLQLSVAGTHGLLSKGKIDGGQGKESPYSLHINPDGRLVFAFRDTDGKNQAYTSSPLAAPGSSVRIALTRQRKTEAKDDGSVKKWFDINFYRKDGSSPATHFGYQKHEGADPSSSGEPMEIGRAFLAGYIEARCKGLISEVRIWAAVLPAADLGVEIKGNEKGLISWWRFEENKGNLAYDSKSANHARFKGSIKWVKNPDFAASAMQLFRDGEPVPATDKKSTDYQAATRDQFTLGALGNARPQAFFQGEIEEVRVWQVPRTQEQIQDNIFRRLVGEKEDLIAYYTFDAEKGNALSDQSLRGNNLVVTGASYVISTAPIGEDTPQVRSALAEIRTPFSGLLQGRPSAQEYGDIQYDRDGNLIGALKRCYTYLLFGQWRLVTGFKVGNLETEWIGQVQTAPELKGYIEGAPPVPTENLNITDYVLGEFTDYTGASSVEMVDAENTMYTYSATRNSGMNTSLDFKLGVLLDFEAEAGFGLVTKIADAESELDLHVTFESHRDWVDEASTGRGLATTKISKIELRGYVENVNDIAYPYPKIGRRFIPDNMGYALVQSETADVFALRLAHTGALVSYQMRPNPDIPKDWNIISFPINRFYTKQGTLDGKIAVDVDPDYPNAFTYSPDSSYFKPIEAYALKNRIQREEEMLRVYYEQFSKNVLSFGSGNLLEKLELGAQQKRNLVNTYVWTSDGGLFSETEETIEVKQQSSGSAYGFKAMAGVYTDLKFTAGGVGMKLGLDALIGGHLELTTAKSVESETSYSLNVDLGKVERDIYLRNEAGEMVLDLTDPRHPATRFWPGKVNAYRFMTFYLEPKTEHFDAFFDKVIDPIWLEQSEDPNAEALRKAKGAQKKPAPWRIFHRVTFVSRILPDISDTAAPPLEKTLKELDIDSNYELIKLLEPFVADKLSSFAEFAGAIRGALKTYHPALQAHSEAIIQYMSLYYGITDYPGRQAGAEEFEAELLDEGIPLPPSVDAGPDTLVATVSGELELQGALANNPQPLENLLILWSKVSGPGSVDFSSPNSLTTMAKFGERGAYALRLSVNDGLLIFSDTIEILVNTQPQISAGADREITLRETMELVGALLDSGLGDDKRGEIRLKWEKVDGPGTVTFRDSKALRTQATFSKSGTYLLRLTVNNGSFEANDEVLISVAGRVTGELQALYVFKEGQGSLVHDVSSIGSSLPLMISNLSKVKWVEGGLAISEPAALQTTGSLAKMIAAMQASDEFTVEAWIKPSAQIQPGLARILTVSAGPNKRNLTLGQRDGRFYAAVRTDSTNENASDKALSGGEVVFDTLIHLVATRERGGSLRLFIDGQEAAQRMVAGSFANWDKAYPLILGDERPSGSQLDRAWSGEFHLVALYARALTPAEVKQNFEYGADTNLPPIVSAGNDLHINLPDRANLVARLLDERLPGDQLKVSWAQAGGPTNVDFKDPGAIETLATFQSSGRYVLRVTVSDGELSSSDELGVIVNQAPAINAGPEQIIRFPDSAELHGVITNTGIGDDSSLSRLTISWKQVSGPGKAVIEDSYALDSRVSFPESGVYTFQLSVDNGLLAPTLAEVTLYVNRSPVIRASAESLINLPGKATLKGEEIELGLADPSGKVTRKWMKASGPGEVTFEDANASSTTAAFSRSGIYRLQWIVETSGVGYRLRSEAGVEIIANQAPEVDAGLDQVITLPTLAELDSTSSDDGLPDPPGRVTHLWSKKTGQGEVTFTDPASDITTAAFSSKGIYILELAVSDGGASVSDQVSITVNSPPAFDTATEIRTNPDKSVALQVEITDDGLGDPALGSVSVRWQPIGDGLSISDLIALRTNAVASKRGRYPVDLTVSNGFASVTTRINVAVFDPPQIKAGNGGIVRAGQAVQLAGQILDTGLDQADPALLNAKWEIESAPAGPEFSNSADLAATVRFPVKGIYTLRLEVDNGSFQSTDILRFTVNQTPQIKVPPSQGLPLNATLLLAGQVLDDGLGDPALGALTSLWTIVSGPSGALIDQPATLQPKATFGQRGIYTLRLEVSNGYLANQAEVRIGVNQIPEVDAGSNQSVKPETKVTLSGVVLDSGLADPSIGKLSYQWRQVSGPQDVKFKSVDTLQTQVTLSRAGTYVFEFRAGSGTLFSSDQVQVEVVK